MPFQTTGFSIFQVICVGNTLTTLQDITGPPVLNRHCHLIALLMTNYFVVILVFYFYMIVHMIQTTFL